MESKYMSPLTDFGFKKLFGEEGNKNLLINFLNDLLPIKNKIIDISFKKNQQLGENVNDRSSIFDIFCEDSNKNQFIVEMQNARQTYFKDRAIFYSTFPIRDQARKGNWNYKLKSVYCVGLLGFNLSDNDRPESEEEIIEEYIHKVSLKDQNNKIFYDKFKFIFIELPKFKKKENEIKDHFEKWMYFLKNLEDFENIPAILNEPIFEEAFRVAEIANYGPKQRAEYEISLKHYRDNINIIETAKREGEAKGRREGEAKGRIEGEAKGRIEGEAKGRIEGEAKGRIEGKMESKIEAIRAFLDICDDKTIANRLEVNIEEVRSIRLKYKEK